MRRFLNTCILVALSPPLAMLAVWATPCIIVLLLTCLYDFGIFRDEKASEDPLGAAFLSWIKDDSIYGCYFITVIFTVMYGASFPQLAPAIMGEDVFYDTINTHVELLQAIYTFSWLR